MPELEIRYDDGLFYNITRAEITKAEEIEIIEVLKRHGLNPTKIEIKETVTTFILGGFLFYLVGRYALDPVFDVIDKEIRSILMKDKRRKQELEQYKKELN